MARTRKGRRKQYPGYLEQHGAGYRVTFCIGGVRQKVKLPTDDREDAEAMARKRYDELKTQAGTGTMGQPRSLKMSNLIEEFEALDMPVAAGAQRAYRDSLKAIRKYFVELRKDPLIMRIRPEDVQFFMDWRASHARLNGKGTVSGRTVAKDRAVLHRMFRRAVKRGRRTGNPVADTERPKRGDTPEYVILDGPDFDRLLEACGHNPMLQAYVLLLGETGLRSESEALRLRWEDLDFEHPIGRVRVVTGSDGHRTKSGKSRVVPMTPRLRRALLEHRLQFQGAKYDTGTSPWVFHHTMTRRHHKAGQRIGSLYDAFKGAAKRAGLPSRLRLHDLRHRRVTTWLAEGKPMHKVKKAMGHSSIKTTEGYEHMVDDDLFDLVEDVPNVPKMSPEIGRSRAVGENESLR